MDKRDEFQLVRFILKFKTVMFLTSGIVPLCYLGLRSHGCLEAIEDGDAQRCVTSAVSSADGFSLYLAFELLRIVLIWTAYGLLASGYAVGGYEEIAALEHVRLDVADGTLDGETGPTQNHQRKRSNRMESANRVKAELERQRAHFGATRRSGGVLPLFMLYDVAALLGLFALWLALYAMPRGVNPSSPVFWSSLYNLRTMYGLLSFPFFIFEVPLVGVLLLGAQPTAYDQAGKLVGKLTKPEVAERYRQEVAIRVLQQRWRSADAAARREAMERWRACADYGDDNWLRRQLDSAVRREVATDESLETSADAARVIDAYDLDEAMHQVRLLIQMGTKGSAAVSRAAAAAVVAAKRDAPTIGLPAAHGGEAARLSV